MYNAILKRRPTLIGKTQTHNDPGGGNVSGSKHVNDLQSKLGGGGGNIHRGDGNGALCFFEEDPDGGRVGE